jgi:hypothetical protein
MAARNFEQLTKYRARLVKEMQCKSVVEELLSAGVLLRAHEDQITVSYLIQRTFKDQN